MSKQLEDKESQAFMDNRHSAWQTWHDACLTWYEQYAELEEEKTDAVF